MLDSPFRGRDAVAAGLVTSGQLRGPRFRTLFSGVFVRSDVEAEYAMWCMAGVLTVDGRGVLGGWSAAELLGASYAPRFAPVELIVPGSSAPTRPGLVVRADRLAAHDITRAHGVAVTTALRTAFDLGRRSPMTEAICASTRSPGSVGQAYLSEGMGGAALPVEGSVPAGARSWSGACGDLASRR